MTDTYEAKVLADSISPDGVRLLTVQATFPRFILAEVNTHRVFSRNSASSRAIPPEKLIERVQKSPFIPETFNARVKGMGVGEEVDEMTAREARMWWSSARIHAIESAQKLLELDIDKSRINRLLEPFMWHTAIISSTEWENFFALRCPPGEEATIDFPAQLEFQKIAILMRRVMRESQPREVGGGMWHLPLVTREEVEAEEYRAHGEAWPEISAGRCARVSFDTHENYEEPMVSYERAQRLLQSGHLSPFEHQATPVTPTLALGNFFGWKQLRQEIPFEDNRVGHLERRDRWDKIPVSAG